MSFFSRDVKNEITRNKATLKNHRTAQAYGLLLFAQEFSPARIALVTTHRPSVRLFTEFLYEVVGIGGTVTVREARRGEGRVTYTATVDSAADRLAVLEHFGGGTAAINPAFLAREGAAAALLSGAYLACGSVTDPTKSYHLDFTLAHPALATPLADLLTACGAPPKRMERRGKQVLYYKESEHIEDVLTLVGASNAALLLMEAKIYKDMRNVVNRRTNCETANIDKMVNAGTRQAEAIRRLYDTVGEQHLPEELRTVARLRLENPDISLRELCELCAESGEKISRSGLNHRLARLVDLAAGERGRG